MSEEAPGKYPLTPAELEVLNAQDQTKIEKANTKLDALAQEMGYVRVATFDEFKINSKRHWIIWLQST